MSTAQTTVVVVPRERFSTSETALESLLANTPEPLRLVYVDGGSPAKVAGYLRTMADRHGFDLIRSERHLSPNAARNLALARVQTPFVAFCDNDLVVQPGWLQALERAADDTGADVVGPLYFEGDPAEEIIHVAGGEIRIDEHDGRRVFSTDHLLQGTRLAEVREPLERSSCDFVEFHCMLVRGSVFDRLGPLDEQLKSTREHLDLCMSVRKAGGQVWFEPGSRVTYTTPPPLAWSDAPFYLRRWSDAWNTTSLHHFYDKWDLEKDFSQRIRKTGERRRVVFQPIQREIRRRFGARPARAFHKVLAEVEPRVNRVLYRAARG